MKAQYLDVGLAGAKTIQIKKVDQDYLDTPFHFHQSCELVLIETSYGKRIVGDRVDNFEVGDLVLMGPNLPHIWQNDKAFHRNMKGGAPGMVQVPLPGCL
ncbi:hypothetical protein [Paraflavitalea speifideaquila]|uniref:hypothetical protein n=1 Tax=Paraflavitalea speifideaquila TaxID=3076558 RepID=UPI0028E95334|nr:hypothetical protein [Paraflavitalea speifideiaquila]